VHQYRRLLLLGLLCRHVSNPAVGAKSSN
jgi:hypothetical protein